MIAESKYIVEVAVTTATKTTKKAIAAAALEALTESGSFLKVRVRKVDLD
jgi:hypothetical protein